MRHLLHYTPPVIPRSVHHNVITRNVMPGLTGHLINKESSLTHISIKTTTLDRGVIHPDSQQVNAASVQKSKYPKKHIVLIYRDLTSTNKTACGEYASRTLSSKQAPSMANTIAIDSKQGRRAKPEGSPSLLCAFHPRFWGEDPDECRSSIHLGKIMGKK